MIRQSVLSLELVQVPVFARGNGVATDPTGYVVQMAFPIQGTAPSTWFAATWDDDDDLFLAQCLVGPAGTATLPIGNYDVYVKIPGAVPEVPVKPAGKLVIY